MFDDYAHHPTEVRATLEAARTLGARRVIACFQPHLFSRTRMLARQFGEALALADVVAVVDVYPAREGAEDFPGVSGLTIARAAADAAGGRRVLWTPSIEEAAARLAAETGEGDVVLTLGAGDVDALAKGSRSPRRRGARLPAGAPDHGAHRRAGRLLRPPRQPERLAELLAWADSEGLEVGVIGSGSNLLVADAGFRGLVMKLDGALASIERDGTRLLCGGGARLPQASARAAREGLSGLEFGVNIPGTVGGAVKMNANAYGGDLSRVLEWVDVATPAGTDRRAPADLGFSYRNSNLGPREIVAAASFALEEADPAAVKATLAEMRAQRKAAQPSGIKTFGSTFKNPDDPRAEGRSAGVLLDEAGCRGLTSAARASPEARELRGEQGEATTADVIALMAEGRRRVRERFGVELEPEVQLLGDVDARDRGE